MVYTSPYCARSLVLSIILLSLTFFLLCMILSIVTYKQFAHVKSDETTQLVLTDAAVQCGVEIRTNTKVLMYKVPCKKLIHFRV